MLYKKNSVRSCGKLVRRRQAKHRRLDSWDINISFSLGQSQNNSSMINIKVKCLDMTLDDPTGSIDGF